jgi:hypothetical protein
MAILKNQSKSLQSVEAKMSAIYNTKGRCLKIVATDCYKEENEVNSSIKAAVISKIK